MRPFNPIHQFLSLRSIPVSDLHQQGVSHPMVINAKEAKSGLYLAMTNTIQQIFNHRDQRLGNEFELS